MASPPASRLPRAPRTAAEGAAPKERLLVALDDAADRGNVLDVGIDALLREAGVAKASLYSNFGSKDALLVAWLDRRQLRWFGYFDAFVAAHANPSDARQELDAAFGFLEAWLARDDFRGCPFVTAFVQLRDPAHPVAARAKEHAQRLLAFFRARLADLGASDVERAAATLLDLFLGAVVVAQLGTVSGAGAGARRAARDVVAAATRTRARPSGGSAASSAKAKGSSRSAPRARGTSSRGSRRR